MPDTSDGAVIKWTVHPAKEEPGKASFTIIVILLTSFASYIYMDSLYFSIVAIILLAGGLRKFLFPTTFILSPEGVEIKLLGTSRRQEWSYFKRVIRYENGISLSPFEKPRWLESFRSWYLYKTNKGIEEYIEQCLTIRLRSRNNHGN